jgi:hypothetical protein
MRTTIPEKKILTCDRCKKEITGTPDLEMRLNIADRDLRGDICYGHTLAYDFCWTCTQVMNKAIDIAIKT